MSFLQDLLWRTSRSLRMVFVIALVLILIIVNTGFVVKWHQEIQTALDAQLEILDQASLGDDQWQSIASVLDDNLHVDTTIFLEGSSAQLGSNPQQYNQQQCQQFTTASGLLAPFSFRVAKQSKKYCVLVSKDVITSLLFWNAAVVALFSLMLLLASFVMRGQLGRWLDRNWLQPWQKLQEAQQSVAEGHWDIDVADFPELKEWQMEQETMTNMLQGLQKVAKTYHQVLHDKDEELAQQLTRATALQVSLKKYESALENASDHVVILDEKQRVLYTNKKACRDLGWTANDAQHKPITEIWNVSGSDQDDMRKVLKDIAQTKTPTVIELNTTKKNGNPYVAELHVSPIVNEKNDIEYYLVIEHDITRLKELQKVKDEFLSLASHELRTPMTIVKGYASLLLKDKFGELNDKQREYILKIHHSTAALIDLVNDMLDVNKLETETFHLHMTKVNINEFITNMADEFYALCDSRGQTVIADIPEQTLCAESDAERLHQVFANLIGNAHKFAPDGGQITVRANTSPQHTGMILCAVKDNGCGIDPAMHEKIFEKFGQVENHLDREVEGTGLGLSIVKTLVEKMGGKVWVESEVDQGATFWFTVKEYVEV